MTRKLLFALLSVLTIQTISTAQGMITEIPLSQQIKKSSLVVEGKVISNKVVWNEKHNNIYTVHTVEVYKVFKGEPVATIEVITHGGTLDFTTQTVTPSLKLNVSDVGVFTLYDNNISLSSKDKSSIKKFKPYSSLQGFYKYNLFENTAINPFSKKKNISKLLYNEISSHTKSAYKELVPFYIESKFSKSNQSKGLLAPGNIVFAPTTITAAGLNGTESLTITGTGFGSIKGKVGFSNADDGGTTFVDALDSQVTNWSDTEITVKVPSGAGTGIIRVTDNGGFSEVSVGQLTVSYALLNSVESGIAFLRQHVGEDMDGEMTWRMNTDFNANTPAKESFLRAFEDWRCNTGINWVIGPTTSVDEEGVDGVNVITFDDSATVPLDDGILGACITISGGCGDVRHVVPQLDIIFNDDVDSAISVGVIETWYYGADETMLGSDNYDFQSVALHELGHGHQLGHVINSSSDVMHYTFLNGQHKRTLNTNNETAAGIIQGFSTSTQVCSQFSMTNYSGSCDLGVEDNSLENSISIYPNPTKQQFFIKSAFVNLDKVEIYDVSGRLISEIDVSDASRTKTINLINVSKGMYFVNIHSENAFFTKKLIVD